MNNFNDLINETNDNDLVIVNVGSSASCNDNINSEQIENHSNIYWNQQNQNEETFLQNLFANTLLNDDFSKDVDFDSLGLDNLQLNLVATNNHVTVGSPSINETSTILPHSNTTNDLVNNYMKNELIDSSHKPSTASSSKIIITNDLIFPLQVNHENSNNDLSTTPTIGTSATSESSIESNNLLIGIKSFSNDFVDKNQDDDKLFKKPLNDHFISNSRRESSIEQKQIINLIQSIDLMSSSTLECKKNNDPIVISKNQNLKNQSPINKQFPTTVINLDELKNQLKSLKKISSNAAKPETNNLTVQSGCSSTQSTLNKFLSLKRSRKQRSKILNSQTSSSSNKTIKEDEFIGKNSTSKFFNIKQTKLLSSAASTLMTNKSAKKSDSKISKEKLKQMKKNAECNNNSNTNVVVLNLTDPNLSSSAPSSTNFEPLSKKFAVDNEPSNNNDILIKNSKTEESNLNEKISETKNNSNNSNNNNVAHENNLTIRELIKNKNNMINKKKDEFDLGIKDLSLLDLHSSEDDTAADFIIKEENQKHTLKKNTRASSNDRLTLIHSPPPISTANNISNNFKINEILTKRIKFTPSSSTSPIINYSATDSNRLDNRIFSLTKSFDSTIDTDTTNIQINNFNSNSTDSFQSIQPTKIIILNNSNTNNTSNSVSISSLPNTSTASACSSSSMLSPSTSNSSIIKLKNKRKKKEIFNSNTNGSNDDCFVSSNQQPHTSKHTIQQRNKSDSFDNSNNQIVLINSSQLDSQSFCLENDTVQYMKNLDINNDLNNHITNATASSTSNTESNIQDNTCDLNFKLNLNDSNSRNYLWNLLKSHSTIDEIKSQFGSMLHDKITFWDLVQLKLKFSQTNQLKTTYEIIDDYTMLYSNMSTLLEKIVKDHSKNGSSSSLSKKVGGGENSSRSRSSSRNCRKQSTNSLTK